GPRQTLAAQELGPRLLHAAALRHVGGEEDAGTIVPEADGRGRQLHLEGRLVLRVVPPHPKLALQVALRTGLEVLDLAGREEIADGHGEELVARVAVVQDGGVVDGQDGQRLHVEDPGGERCALEELTVTRLGLAERLLRATEADQGAHGGDEDRRLHGLGQVAVRPAVEAAHGVPAVHEGRRHLEGEDGGRVRIALDAAADLVAADVGELHVEDYEVWPLAAQRAERLVARGHFHHPVAGLGEHAGNGVAVRALVVHDEHEPARECRHSRNPAFVHVPWIRATASSREVWSFDSTANARLSSPARSSGSRDLEVTTTTGMWAVRGSSLSRTSTSAPEMSGMERSRKTMSGRRSLAAWKPSMPLGISVITHGTWLRRRLST